MSRRTPSQQAAIESAQRASIRQVQQREAALLRAMDIRRIARRLTWALCIASVLCAAAIGGFVAGVSFAADTQQGRASGAP